ncbi:MAG: phosphoribosylanthranilate isomerase [Methylophilus sp.]
MRTRVKICGITRQEDAWAAIDAGADALGFVFYAPSPRAVTATQVQAIVKTLPPYISKVGLFVNASADEVNRVIDATFLDCLQFHGDEAADYCEKFNLPYYKAIRVKPDVSLVQCELDFVSASALLLDTFSEKAVGGTGQIFDWALIPAGMKKPLILAGGLHPDNITQALQQVQPYAVDVSGGVEAQKGIKSPEKIAAFMQQVTQYDASRNAG